MGGCCGNNERKFYMVTAAGVAKIVAIVAGSAPVILAFILYDHYTKYPRPDSDPRRIRIPKDVREKWELAFLIVVAGSLGITVLNLIFYTCFNCLSKNTWTKRFDCTYFTLGGAAQAIVGFIMVASALTSTEEEPLEIKYASGFLGIATGIIYWGAGTLVNQD